MKNFILKVIRLYISRKKGGRGLISCEENSLIWYIENMKGRNGSKCEHDSAKLRSC